jgi:hypothetical protein
MLEQPDHDRLALRQRTVNFSDMWKVLSQKLTNKP